MKEENKNEELKHPRHEEPKPHHDHPHHEHGPHEEHHEKRGHENKIVHDLEERMKKLETSLKEAEDKAMREKADAINYRKRKDEEVARMMKYASEDMIKEMLPIVDSFERAIEMDDDNLEDEVSKFLKGFKMIYGNLLTVLEKFEIKPVKSKINKKIKIFT